MDDILRDTSLYSTRHISVGAFLEETAAIVDAVSRGSNPRGVGVRIQSGTLLGDHSRVTRQRIWDEVQRRHYSCAPLWIAREVGEAHALGSGSPELHWLIYLHYAMRDHLTFDVITRAIWPRWRTDDQTVSLDAGLAVIKAAEADQVEVCRWSADTRRRLVLSIFETLSELGVLLWRSGWHLQQPELPDPVALHLLRALTSEGKGGADIMRDEAWTLFFLDEETVGNRLTALAGTHGFTWRPTQDGVHFTPPVDWR